MEASVVRLGNSFIGTRCLCSGNAIRGGRGWSDNTRWPTVDVDAGRGGVALV